MLLNIKKTLIPDAQTTMLVSYLGNIPNTQTTLVVSYLGNIPDTETRLEHLALTLIQPIAKVSL